MPFFFQIQIRRIFSCLLVAVVLFAIAGCFKNYYKVSQPATDEFEEMVQTNPSEKYFIMHANKRIMHLSDILLSEELLSGTLSELPAYRRHFYTTRPDKSNRYRTNEKYVLNEVHIFLNSKDSIKLDTGATSIPLSSVQRVHVYDKDQSATVVSHVVGVVGVSVIPIIIIAAATAPEPEPSGSCPYIYVNNGKDFILQGDVFSGSIFKNLERDDYLPLPEIKPMNEKYLIRFSNELREIQYINNTRLIAVDHPAGTKVLLDKTGAIQTFKSPDKPFEATSGMGMDVLPSLAQKDSAYYIFHENKAYQTVQLKFRKAKDAQSAKLLLSGKNSLWFEMLFAEFTQKYGFHYDHWTDKQDEKPKDQLFAWMEEQDIPLSIYLKVGDEWSYVDHVFSIGPLAQREVVIPIDLTQHFEDEIEIKLQTGYLFWEIDLIAMDFSENEKVEAIELMPQDAINNAGNDVIKLMNADDDDYAVMSEIGDIIDVEFEYRPVKSGYDRTFFLQCKGYYKQLRDYRGLPEYFGLRKFKHPGYFGQFSKDYFNEFAEDYYVQQ